MFWRKKENLAQELDMMRSLEKRGKRNFFSSIHTYLSLGILVFKPFKYRWNSEVVSTHYLFVKDDFFTFFFHVLSQRRLQLWKKMFRRNYHYLTGWPVFPFVLPSSVCLFLLRCCSRLALKGKTTLQSTQRNPPLQMLIQLRKEE